MMVMIADDVDCADGHTDNDDDDDDEVRRAASAETDIKAKRGREKAWVEPAVQCCALLCNVQKRRNAVQCRAKLCAHSSYTAIQCHAVHCSESQYSEVK